MKNPFDWIRIGAKTKGGTHFSVRFNPEKAMRSVAKLFGNDAKTKKEQKLLKQGE